MAFNPNSKTLAACIAHVQQVTRAAKLDMNSGIVTSRDSVVQAVLKTLEVTNIPSGFTKFQLPVIFDGPTTTYMSFGAARTKVPSHSHDEGAGVRVILFGSISYKGHELTAGDWMYIPKGVPYEFEVGNMGVGMFYCYQCCCA
jgi:hypothetical protein